MKHYNKLEIACDIKDISDLKVGKTEYIFGRLNSYDEKDGKKYNFLNMKFVAFGKPAIDLSEAGLREGSQVVMKGSIQEQSYQDRKYIQLIVSSFQVGQYQPRSTNNDDDEYIPAAKRKKENPYRKQDIVNDIEEDDFPI